MTPLALPILVAFACPPGAAYNLSGYLPLAVGNSWTWTNPQAARSREVATIGHKQRISGVEVLVREHDTKLVDYFRPTRRGIEWYGGVVLAKIGPVPWTLKQPILLPSNLKVGDTRTQQLPGSVGPLRPLIPIAVPATLQFTVRLDGLEDVTCAAGRFRDCLRVRMRFDAGKVLGIDTSTDRTVWYARGVGDVKATIKSAGSAAVTTTLRSATIRGKKIP
jgi:hypothetical protein